MNKDTVQTIKNLIELRPIYGYHPDDIEIQEQHIAFIRQRILDLNLLNTSLAVISKRIPFKSGRIAYENVEYCIFTFQNHQILLEEYQDYLRALLMVLEDTPQEDIAECYLMRQEEPNYNNIDKSILTEPLEPTEYIEYVEGTNIAYFQEIEEEDIKRIEQQVLELLEKEIQK